MADLRSRFIEDYAGGVLNVARQELSTTGEVLAQDGFTSEGTLFVEDGSGTKSGLRLGVSLAEAVDPTTEIGVVNVRYADRTYAKIRDLKIFSTAIASAQAALSEAASTSLSNIETTLQLLEDDLNTVEQNFQQSLTQNQEQLQVLSLSQRDLTEKVEESGVAVKNLENRVISLERPSTSPQEIEVLSTNLNAFYYSGTIAISNANVTGTNTAFEEELEVGSVFIATTSAGEEVEFRVTGLDSDTPGTKLTVFPTNRTVTAGARFKRNQNLELKTKLNEIILAMKQLKFIV
jgi:hypothetical protein